MWNSYLFSSITEIKHRMDVRPKLCHMLYNERHLEQFAETAVESYQKIIMRSQPEIGTQDGDH